MPVLLEICPNRTTVDLSFDDRTRLRVRKRDWEALPLTAGDDIDTDAYEARVCARQLNEAYEAALTCLDYSARSESEIRKKLAEKGFLPPVLDAVVLRLTEARLLDDRELARRVTESAAKSRGIYAVKRKLRARGIREEDAGEALSEVSEDDQRTAAEEAARKLLRKYGALEPRECRAKLSQALARRGFSWSAVSEALESVLSDDVFDD